jgi:hypothetical protein
MTVSFSVSVLVMGDAPAPLDILFLRTERSEGSGASGALEGTVMGAFH